MYNNRDSRYKQRPESDHPKGPVLTFLENWWTHVWNLIPISMTYCAMYLLALPCGLGAVGMAEVSRNLTVQGHSFGFSDFCDAIKQSWRTALPAGLLNLLISAFVLFVGWFYLTSGGLLAMMGLGCALTALCFHGIMKYYLWTILATFRLPLGKAMKNSALFVFVNWKRNLLAAAVCIGYYVLCGVVCILIPYSITLAIVAMVTLFLFVGFRQMLIQTCVFPSVKEHMLDPYYAEHPDEDVERRKRLGF